MVLALGACSPDGSTNSPRRLAPTEAAAGIEPDRGPGVQGVVSVTISPASATVQAESAVVLTATVVNHAGETLQKGGMLTWTSSAPGIATVTPGQGTSGVVTGVAAGSVTITATAKNGTSGFASVTVTGGSSTQTLIAAGDIGVCATTYDEATANLLDNIPGTIALLGDNAYPNGSSTDYTNCFEPSWGRHKARMKPSTGNHEYQTAGAAGYFGYFGSVAGDPAKGYYSYELGDWHVVVLNSNCSTVSCMYGSTQEQWLRADLAATTKSCVLAYWHHPRWSSDAIHPGNTSVQPFWDALYQYGAELILNGHSHVYERFGPQTPTQVSSPTYGIRQITVGTGGKSPLYSWGTIKPNSQVRNNATWGVLKLTLGSGTYSWNFVPVAGQSWTDSGSGTCH